jgi:uncharacterized membrane protein
MKFIGFASFFLLSVLIFASGASLLAQSNPAFFAPVVTYGPGGLNPDSIAVADVNGDGKPDLIVTSSCATNNCAHGTVGVLLGNGDGTFQAAAVYDSGGDDASSVAVADVNGDGKLDVIVTNYYGLISASGDVGVLLGNGDGTFQAAVLYDSGGWFANSVVVRDVNGDGKPDLLVATNCARIDYTCGSPLSPTQVGFAPAISDLKPGSVGVLLGNGDGTFQAAANYETGTYRAKSIGVADVNGDGKLDVIVTNQVTSFLLGDGSDVGVLLGNGDGTFQAAVNYVSGGYGFFEQLVVADVNRDSKPDVLVANTATSQNQPGPGNVGVLLGNGNGTFQAVSVYDSGAKFPMSVAVADVNGDGNLDIVVANQCQSYDNCPNGVLTVLLGNGDGTFQAASAVINSGGSLPMSLAVADVNGDGKPDVLLANYSSSTVGVLINETPWQYKAVVQHPINADGSSVFSAKRGVVPVKFAMSQYGTQPSCTLPATIAVNRIGGGTLGSIDEGTYVTNADSGSNFRIDQTACQYIYNLAASSLGVGTYRVDISINGITNVGHAVFALQ